MKIQNPTKLDIFFKGGGIIKFPVQNLKQIDIEPINGDGGGSDEESPAELTKLDILKNYVNLLYDIEFDVIEETSTFEEQVMDENEDLTGEVITVTQKDYKFVPKTSVPRVYLDRDTISGSTSPSAYNGLELHTSAIDDLSSPSVISKIILDNTELTVQQLMNYDIVQVGVAKVVINTPHDTINDYAGYLGYLDWIRNNAIENAEVPILLYGEETNDNTKMYYSNGFIGSTLSLNNGIGSYSQTVFEVLEEEQ